MRSKQVKPLQTPALGTQDAIGYLAVNPVRPDEIAMATFERNIFLSTDGGQTWKQIAHNGKPE